MMRIIKDYTMRWWQVSLLKISMMALGLAVCATWPGAFEGLLLWLWLIFAAPRRVSVLRLLPRNVG